MSTRNLSWRTHGLATLIILALLAVIVYGVGTLAQASNSGSNNKFSIDFSFIADCQQALGYDELSTDIQQQFGDDCQRYIAIRDWGSFTVEEKINLNPFGCYDLTQIRADNGQCLSGGSKFDNALLFANWPQLTIEQKIALNPYNCEVHLIRADNGKCLASMESIEMKSIEYQYGDGYNNGDWEYLENYEFDENTYGYDWRKREYRNCPPDLQFWHDTEYASNTMIDVEYCFPNPTSLVCAGESIDREYCYNGVNILDCVLSTRQYDMLDSSVYVTFDELKTCVMVVHQDATKEELREFINVCYLLVTKRIPISYGMSLDEDYYFAKQCRYFLLYGRGQLSLPIE